MALASDAPHADTPRPRLGSRSRGRTRFRGRGSAVLCTPPSSLTAPSNAALAACSCWRRHVSFTATRRLSSRQVLQEVPVEVPVEIIKEVPVEVIKEVVRDAPVERAPSGRERPERPVRRDPRRNRGPAAEKVRIAGGYKVWDAEYGEPNQWLFRGYLPRGSRSSSSSRIGSTSSGPAPLDY